MIVLIILRKHYFTLTCDEKKKTVLLMYHFFSPQLAIKSFDKTRLKSVETLDQSQVKITGTRCSGEHVERGDVMEAPQRSKLMHRRHTISVPLSADNVSDDSLSISQSRDCCDDLC